MVLGLTHTTPGTITLFAKPRPCYVEQVSKQGYIYIYLGVSNGLDGGCSGAVVQDGQLSKQLPHTHGPTQLSPFLHLDLSIWSK